MNRKEYDKDIEDYVRQDNLFNNVVDKIGDHPLIFMLIFFGLCPIWMPLAILLLIFIIIQQLKIEITAEIKQTTKDLKHYFKNLINTIFIYKILYKRKWLNYYIDDKIGGRKRIL